MLGDDNVNYKISLNTKKIDIVRNFSVKMSSINENVEREASINHTDEVMFSEGEASRNKVDFSKIDNRKARSRNSPSRKINGTDPTLYMHKRMGGSLSNADLVREFTGIEGMSRKVLDTELNKRAMTSFDGPRIG